MINLIKKDIFILLIILISLISSFWGCGLREVVTRIPEGSPAIEESRVFNKDYDSVWSAIVKTISSRRYSIQSIDKGSGAISTGFLVTKKAFMLSPGYRHKLNIFVEKKSISETRVTITPVFEYRHTDESNWSVMIGMRSANMVNLETGIFDEIQKNLL